MPSTYEYVAKERTGERRTGSLDANDESQALRLLEERGLAPIRVRAVAGKQRTQPARKRGVSARALARVFRQMSDLLRAGVPLLRTLELMERQSPEPELTEAFGEIRRSVSEGEGLAESLKRHPHLFDDLAIGMIRAGQEGGFLEDVLARIADYAEQEEELKGKVAGALAYPAFLSIVGTIVITVLVVFFVPQFETVFARLADKGQLPAVTVGLLATSEFLRSYGLILLAGLGGLAYAYREWVRTPEGRHTVDRLKLSLPQIGNILRGLAVARFCRVLGTMLGNGIPILFALRISKDSCGNLILSEAISAAADNVTTGKTLAEPLRESDCFPRDVIEMVTIAEESNTLEKVLVEIAESTERRTMRQLELFVRLLEPMMLLVMAAVTLVVVAALLIPVIRMSSALG